MSRPKRKGIHGQRAQDLLKRFRESLRLKPDQFAQLLNVSRILVIKYEGRLKGFETVRPPIKYLHRVNQLKRKVKEGLTRKQLLASLDVSLTHDFQVAQNNVKVRTCKRQKCSKPFIPAVHNQIYCQISCKRLDYQGK